MERLVVVGCGELGMRVARRWIAAGGEAVGVTATTTRHDTLAAVGISPRLDSDSLPWQPSDRVLFAVPGSARQRDAVRARQPCPGRTVLVSSTTIYGQAVGTVDEHTPPRDPDARALAAAELEAAFHNSCRDGVVLRCGGLYRAGRGPAASVVRRGEARPGPPDRTLALVHYEDVATAVLAALRHPAPEPCYLVVSPPCPTREAFYMALAKAHGIDPNLTEPLGQEPARYVVALLRRDLLPAPQHGDWREALAPWAR